MKIALFCATNRGYLFAKELFDIAHDAEITVFSFRETPWEPPYIDKIRELVETKDGIFFEARSVSAGKWQNFWNDNEFDIMFMISWRYIIPKEVYGKAKLGAFVFHDSLLPNYRGFAPTVWSIINGEDHTGVSVIYAVDEVDAGDIIAQQKVPISPEETITEVIEKVTKTYLTLLPQVYPKIVAGTIQATPQNHELATFTCKWTPEDAKIVWTKTATEIHNLIRATGYPYPGAYTSLDGKKLIIWNAFVDVDAHQYVSHVPGRVLRIFPDKSVQILTGNGVLRIQQIQIEDQKPTLAGNIIKSLSQTLGR